MMNEPILTITNLKYSQWGSHQKGYLKIGLQLFFPFFRRFLKDQDPPIFENLNWTLSNNEIVGLCFKTDLELMAFAKLISGNLLPDSGRVKLSEKPLLFGFPGKMFKPMLTVSENVKFSMTVYSHGLATESDFEQAIQFSELESKRESLLYDLNPEEIKKLGTSSLLFAPAKLLVVANFWGSGDADFRRKAFEKLKERIGLGRALLLSTDLKTLFSLTSKVLTLENNKFEVVKPIEQLDFTELELPEVSLELDDADHDSDPVAHLIQISSEPPSLKGRLSISEVTIAEQKAHYSFITHIFRPGQKIQMRVTVLFGVPCRFDCVNLIIRGSYKRDDLASRIIPLSDPIEAKENSTVDLDLEFQLPQLNQCQYGIALYFLFDHKYVFTNYVKTICFGILGELKGTKDSVALTETKVQHSLPSNPESRV